MSKKKKSVRVIGRRRDTGQGSSWSDPGGLVSVRRATADDIANFLSGDIGEFDPLDSVGSDVWDRSGSTRPSADDLAYLESQGFVEVEPNRWRCVEGLGSTEMTLGVEAYSTHLHDLLLLTDDELRRLSEFDEEDHDPGGVPFTRH
jgi:hypothetical protein